MICGDCGYYRTGGACWMTRATVGYMKTSCEHWIPKDKNTQLIKQYETSMDALIAAKANERAAAETKVCECCGRELPIEEFALTRKNSTKRFNSCKECMNKKAKEKAQMMRELKAAKKAAKESGSAPKKETKPEPVEEVEIELAEPIVEKKPEAVNHPNHYTLPNGIEALDIARYLSFNLGNVVKYVVRAGRKDGNSRRQDLQKALFYIQDEIAHS